VDSRGESTEYGFTHLFQTYCKRWPKGEWTFTKIGNDGRQDFRWEHIRQVTGDELGKEISTNLNRIFQVSSWLLASKFQDDK